MKHVVVAWPTGWEQSELARPEVASRYRFSYLPLDALGRGPARLSTDVLGQISILRIDAFIEATLARLRRAPPDGIIGTEDHLGAVLAPCLAAPLGLPAPSPESLITCQHKYASRCAQARHVPEATPRFALYDPSNGDLDGLAFPCFVKPVRGSFSVFARRVEDHADLRRHTTLSPFERWVWDMRQRPFDALLRRYTRIRVGPRLFLAEALMGGRHVSLEGFVHRGEVRAMGVLDAAMYEGTDSFRRFTTPSTIPSEVQARMADVATRVMTGVGFDDGLFEIEMFWDPERDLLRIIEINPRMCPQFADLMEKVHGANSFDVLLSIATGEAPRWEPFRGEFGCAASFVLRAFEGERVVRMPTQDEIARAQERFPDLRVQVFAKEGTEVSSRVRALHDCASVRIATVHLGGADRADLMERCRAALALLPFAVTPPRDYARELTADG